MLLLKSVPYNATYRRYCSADIKIRPLLLVNGKPLIKLSFRRQATTTNSPENEYEHEQNDLHHDLRWPKQKHPTPYEIFGLTQDGSTSSANMNRRILKKRYHEFAKLYHPDISQNIKIIRSPIAQETRDRSLLSFDEKLLRFKIMTQAYEILSDTRKRKLYDYTKSNWAYGPSPNTAFKTGTAYPNRHGYQSNSTYEYWNAGTWEEMNDLNKDSSEKEKLDPWTVFLWICGLVVCLEATALLTRIENSLTSQQYTHEETEFDLTQSYMNYGLDSDKFSRLRRFLWFRTYGLYRAKDDLDREAKRNEGMVQDMMKSAADKDKNDKNSAAKERRKNELAVTKSNTNHQENLQ